MSPTEPSETEKARASEGDLAGAFRRAGEARDAIERIVAAVRNGDTDLAGAFVRADADSLVGRCFAVKVFEAVPGVGKVRARRTMESLGLAEDIAIGQVPAPRRTEIIAAFVAEPGQAL